MSRMFSIIKVGALALTLTSIFALYPGGGARGVEDMSPEDAVTQARRLFEEGNFREAWDLWQTAMTNPEYPTDQAATDLPKAINALQRIQAMAEVDGFLDQATAVHSEDWRFLWAAAIARNRYLDHYGFLIAGQFERGQHRGGGAWVDVTERDRAVALGLMERAMAVIPSDASGPERGRFHNDLAEIILSSRQGYGAWRLQSLTDTANPPDYDDPVGAPPQGAPVDAEGEPVFHPLVDTWEAAANDGQRWRWALWQTMEYDSRLRAPILSEYARFLHAQFGVQTLAQGGWFQPTSEDGSLDDTGPFAVHTLSDDETIARLATGPRRFALPEDGNFIRLYQEAAMAPGHSRRVNYNALRSLAELFENRRQYERAADFWRIAGERFGELQDVADETRERLDRIVGHWGSFDATMTQPAGAGAEIDYRFRNGRRVQFTAWELKTTALLEDVKKYIRGADRLDWQRIQIDNIGYRIVRNNEEKYRGDQVAQWDLDLAPAEGHRDRRIAISTPLQKAGAYLLEAKMEDGNESRIVLWLDDTAILKKNLDSGAMVYVADARNGQPVAGAKVDYFGFWPEHTGNNQFKMHVAELAGKTDADGLHLPDADKMDNRHQWIITASTPEGRLAWLGFSHVWRSGRYDAEYNQVRAIHITDRPVYRPDQPVQYKAWLRRSQYDRDDAEDFAGRRVVLEIRNPRNELVHEKEGVLDEWGGLTGEYTLPADALLGMYSLYLTEGPLSNPNSRRRLSSDVGTFRVEEYKTPEFEVTVEAPDEPARLGETIPVKIQARYYFGAPVSEATVRYKVTRTDHSAQWYPVTPWDWFYGPGYWWFGYDYPWYPGWRRWVGCVRPAPWWMPMPQNPPEVVMDGEAPIGPDGTLEFTLDTALAEALYGDRDHRYDITAEVVDLSRRTIVGQGSVLAPRKPYTVYTWLDRGHYREGDTMGAHFQARTLAGKPVAGSGQAVLYRISYDENMAPQETAVEEWNVDTDAQGRASLQMRAGAPGQYRLSYTLRDGRDNAIEGGHIFTIRGPGFDGAGFRFNAIELIPDQKTYAPGDTVNLMINTDRAGAAVLLFIRPSNGVCLAPKVLRLTGKSHTEAIAVVTKDMPNFFVEAVTIHGGRVHSEIREIAVPPEERILNLEITPSKGEYRPGEEATVTARLTDHNGEPYAGSLVMTVYDKAIEYISGGSNVPDIREHFWKWRRHHNYAGETSLERRTFPLYKEGEMPMYTIGIFGDLDTVLDDSIVMSGLGGVRREIAPASRMMRMTGGAEIASMSAPAAIMSARAPMNLGMAAADGAVALDSVAEFAPTDGDLAFGMAPGAAETVQPTVRSEFADTAFWVGDVTTDADGWTTFTFSMPENLTGWMMRSWAMGKGTRVAQATAEAVTKKRIVLRLQAPRFFVEKDEVVLSANIHNYLDSDKAVQAVLELDGECVALMEGQPAVQNLNIAAGGEARVDWRVKVLAEGEVTVRMKALTDEESDAMERRFPVYVHGMDKMVPVSGYLRPDEESATVTLEVPAQRRVEASRLEVRYSPTLALAMVDALPYLAAYPYGCTEQTLNRFLPTVITQNVLMRMGVDLADINEERINLNAQELGDDRERARQWQRFETNPVFDRNEANRMVREGVRALTDMQLSDGGWGWFSGYGERSSAHTTAWVVRGLQIALDNDVAIAPDVVERGIQWLEGYQAGEVAKLKNHEKDLRPAKPRADNLDALIYMVLADGGKEDAAMGEYLYRDRTHLAVYALGLFGLALDRQGHEEERDMVLRNIEQFLEKDETNQTAWLNLGSGVAWWNWYGSEYEAQAAYLKLLARTGQVHDERAPWLVKYLLNNRKHATRWNSTRDTALVVEAFADYLKASGEDKPDMTVEVWIDGEKRQEAHIDSTNLFTFPNRYVIDAEDVKTGVRTVELRKTGRGPLYFNAYLSYFSLEDFIEKAGLEIQVERSVYRLERADKDIDAASATGQVTGLRIEKYDREPLADGDLLKSGDLVEIELVIESKNDYEYVIFEDMKAAGFEPVDVRSGYTGNEMGAYVEFRDNRVAFFVQRLARGRHSVTYRTRAEIPGHFSALPTRGHAMYAPELRANSDEIRLGIAD